jgi:serine/threonine-protein kinase
MTPAPLVSVRQTPDSRLLSSAVASGLPRDLLAVASRRLGILALATIGVAFINLMVAHFVGPSIGNEWPWGGPLDVLTGIVFALSLALWLYTRRTPADPLRVIHVGLLYEVVLCALTALLGHYYYEFFRQTGLTPQLSWVCPLLVFFPAIVPTTPGRTAMAALTGASMDPLFMAIAMAEGTFDAPVSSILWMHFPNYVCAGLGILVSHIITTLGREVRDARDLGSYRLGAVLGRGGMGEVYRAEHRLLARPAAIKLIRPEKLAWAGNTTAQLAIERFRREAQAAATLRSPHTIELYDFGATDDGTFYFVMELLDGVDLASFVTRFGPMAPGRVARVLQQACESLAEAHARDLIHRDIKPANLLLCRMGLRHDFVKVLDFGLVKGRNPEPGNDGSPQTAADIVAGTPAFMSPEAALGDPLDGKTDVYGLGCVGYWLLTGRLVFDAATTFQILSRHIEDVPAPPSSRSESPIPPSLDTAILACLHKDPAARPDALELGASLAACAGVDPWTDEQARRWWHLHLPAAPVGQTILTAAPAGTPA